MAQIEGLYTALRLTGPGPRREQLAADLARAAQRLSAIALATAGADVIIPPRSRWQRRRALAARGANWLITRTSRPTPDGPSPKEKGASGKGMPPM
ncbi:hypothetical protein [Streptomyces sp. WM6378]|uniref:hypothetical protein n=1 Tax=Streptomyces sp. WM6378 TaxID=1415557 RepID=UPI000AF8DD6D|nr:hypothetical protein [Streptomyces sp. WM6378]